MLMAAFLIQGGTALSVSPQSTPMPTLVNTIGFIEIVTCYYSFYQFSKPYYGILDKPYCGTI